MHTKNLKQQPARKGNTPRRKPLTVRIDRTLHDFVTRSAHAKGECVAVTVSRILKSYQRSVGRAKALHA